MTKKQKQAKAKRLLQIYLKMLDLDYKARDILDTINDNDFDYVGSIDNEDNLLQQIELLEDFINK